MELATATRLIEHGVDRKGEQTWADLGAGSGLFTKALASIIESGTIYAIDKDNSDLSLLSTPSVQVQKIKKDFTSKDLALDLCDGILMANSLHYVADKISFITTIKQKLKEHGVLIVIEYERDNSNPWVPYPIRFRELEVLILKAKFSSIMKIGEEPSVFDRSVIYAAVVMQ